MHPGHRWLASLFWAGMWTLAFWLVYRKGMYWCFGAAAGMSAAYSLVLWRTLAWCYVLSRPMPTVWIRQVPQQPVIIRRVILEEERPW